MRAYYLNLCLNCHGKISDKRLFSFGICENCLEKELKTKRLVYEYLKEKGKLREYEKYFNIEKRFNSFFSFFEKVASFKPSSLQKVWAKRILLNRSFSLVAPTGIGKSTLGNVISLFFSLEGKKCYIIVPSSLLVEQNAKKFAQLKKNITEKIRILYYHSKLTKKEKEKVLNSLKNKEFDIFISTEMFLIKNFEILKEIHFDFVFVDDIDSFLKSSKNIDKILYCLGFDEKIIKEGLKSIELKFQLLKIKDKKEIEILKERIQNIKKKIELYKKNNKVGILVVSGATQKQKKSKKVLLFKELLSFDLGFKPKYLRNVKDFFIESKEIKEEVLNIVTKFGEGGLIFVPIVYGKEFVNELANFLKRKKIKVGVYEKTNVEILDKFSKGKCNILIGIASTRSPLTRGIDLPEKIRYVVFAGVPRYEIKLSCEEMSLSKLYTLGRTIKPFLNEKEKIEIERILIKIKQLPPITKETLEKIKMSLECNKRLFGFEGYVLKLIKEMQTFLKKVITEELIEKIRQNDKISLKEKEGEIYLIIPDVNAYIQGSGRTSRLFAGGISKGTSFLIVDDKKGFNGLKEKLKYLLEDFKFIEFDFKKAKSWFEKIDRDRELIKKIKRGEVPKKVRDFIKSALLIVESPTKAKTIASFFGKPAKREVFGIPIYEVATGKYILSIVASKGHLYDLTFSFGIHGVLKENEEFYPVYDFIKKCKKCFSQFTEYEKCPYCNSEEIYSKEEIISALREIALETNEILIGTDADAEGEKIAYDLLCSLHPINNNIKRVEFHEITKKAILKAIDNKKQLNFNLVEAQIVRRIEDRWLGFELSQRLWKVFKNRRLSAGRVQTPVLGWIIERTSLYRKKVNLLEFLFEGEKFKIKEFKGKKKNLKVKVIIKKEREEEIFPSPPYTTSELLRDASFYFKFPVNKTMKLAQDLFEAGLITYHRTSSTSVSSFGVNLAKEYLEGKGMKELFKGRSWKKEGAHECIRPTKPYDPEKLKELIYGGILTLHIKLTKEHFLLYSLIFKRFIASQMKEAIVRSQEVILEVNGNKIEDKRVYEIFEEGFTRVLPLKLKKPFDEGEYNIEKFRIIKVPKEFPYTQGEVVLLMKEKGIGRPSTYAKIVETLLKRKYIIEKNQWLLNTLLGFKVYAFLNKKYSEYVCEETTRKLEETMDNIEKGEENYMDILRELYKEIQKLK